MLDNLLSEERAFPPSEEFAAQANAKANAKAELYERADADREAFWAEQARRLSWETEWEAVLDWSNAPFARWFVGGRLNVAVNCVDRHVAAGHGEQVAFHWEGEPGDTRTITYAELKREVCKAANALLSFGLKAGDRVAIQLPMIPEAVFAMLACARLGMPHSVVFGGFSASALRTRIEDAQAKLLVISDGQYRRGKPAPMKANTDEAVTQTSTIEHVLVVRRTEADVPWTGVATCGGTSLSSASPRSTRRRPSTPSTRCSSSTPQAPPVSPRASCTPPAATSRRPPTPTTSSSTTRPARTSTGAPRTSAG